LIISTSNKRIQYLSHAYIGKEHDYSILKMEFPPQINWFERLEVRLDLGYQGFESNYKCKKLYIPHKKPKNQDLDPEKKEENKALASERIKVEHSIGGMKRYRILSERLRLHDFDLYDDILCVCAGLWNFYLEHK
jgi:DDE superfamily endonuclease